MRAKREDHSTIDHAKDVLINITGHERKEEDEDNTGIILIAVNAEDQGRTSDYLLELSAATSGPLRGDFDTEASEIEEASALLE
jgi:hypothetical protein